jgi:hypothetical protein
MKMMSVLKVAMVLAAVALPASFSAAEAKAKLPPGACAFEKKSVAANTVCSFQCNSTTGWCSEQLCVNGQLVSALPCYGNFCTAKCGG